MAKTYRRALRKYMTEVPVTRAYFDARPDASDEAIRAELEKHPVFRLVRSPDGVSWACVRPKLRAER